jgi:hypothetical protein
MTGPHTSLEEHLEDLFEVASLAPPADVVERAKVTAVSSYAAAVDPPEWWCQQRRQRLDWAVQARPAERNAVHLRPAQDQLRQDHATPVPGRDRGAATRGHLHAGRPAVVTAETARIAEVGGRALWTSC